MAVKRKPPKLKSIHPLQWIVEPLEQHESFAQRKMFGCEAILLHGKLALVLAAGDEPWNGLLICTCREHHLSLITEVPQLKPHPILGKWLYLSQTDRDFEAVVGRVQQKLQRADERIGVETGTRKRKTTGQRTSRSRGGAR